MHRKSFVVTVLSLLLVIGNGCSQPRHLAIGERLEKMGRYGDALGAYQAALSQAKDKDGKLQSTVYYRMGECLLQLDRAQEAFQAFSNAVEADSNNTGARLRLGEILLSAGAPDRAREQAEAAMLRSPRNGEAVALWGASMEGIGRLDKARDAYREALSLEPDRVSVAIALADLYNQNNETTQAREVLEQSAKANPKSASPWLAMARLNEQAGETKAAESAYRRAIQVEDTPETNLRLAQFLQRTSRIAESEQVLRRVDAQRPTEPTALADFQLMAGRPTNALGSYQAALGRETQRTNARTTPAPSIKHERARLAARIIEADIDVANQKNGAEQTSALQRAKEHLGTYRADLDAATLAVLEAELALAENNLPAASEKAAVALSLAPKSAPALYIQGLVRLRCSDPAGARTQWLAALASDSHFAPARLGLGEQALANGDLHGAEAYVLEVVRDEPGNIQGVVLFSRVLIAEKRYPAAALIARRAQALDASAAIPQILMAQIAVETHHPGEALVHYEQAVLLDPHAKEAIEGLTRLFASGRVSRPMLAKMEQVAKAQPASPTLLEIAGRLYAQHGWNVDAERCLKATLQLDPQRTTAAAMLAKTYAATGNVEAASESAARTGGNSATLIAGVKAQDGNDVKTAIRNYENAVKGGESSGVAANNLAWLYAQQGMNLNRALELAQTAQSLLPHDPAVLDTLGVVHLRLREYTEAIKVLESAKQMAARNSSGTQLLAQIRQHLAEAYVRSGATDAATAIERK